MASTIKDFFPFGDLSADLADQVGSALPGIRTDHIMPALALAMAMVDLLEVTSRPLVEYGLSPARWRLLIALRFQSDGSGANIGELARHLDVKEPTVTATVDRAQKDGLVERRRDLTDGRVVRVVLTEHGHATLGHLMPTIAGRIAALTDAIGGPEAVERVSAAIRAGSAAMQEWNPDHGETRTTP